MILLEAFSRHGLGRRSSGADPTGAGARDPRRGAARRAAGRSIAADLRRSLSPCSATSRSRSPANRRTRRTCSARATSSCSWAASNAPTRTRKYHLAFFGQYHWSDVPAIPPEMVFLPGRDLSRSTTCRAGRGRSSCRSRSSTPSSRWCALPAARGVAELFARPDGQRRETVGAAACGETPWKKCLLSASIALLKAVRAPARRGRAAPPGGRARQRLDDRALRGLGWSVGDPAGDGELGDGAQGASATAGSSADEGAARPPRRSFAGDLIRLGPPTAAACACSLACRRSGTR